MTSQTRMLYTIHVPRLVQLSTDRYRRYLFGPSVPLRRRCDSLPVHRNDYRQLRACGGGPRGARVAPHDRLARASSGDYAGSVLLVPDDRLLADGCFGRRT